MVDSQFTDHPGTVYPPTADDDVVPQHNTANGAAQTLTPEQQHTVEDQQGGQREGHPELPVGLRRVGPSRCWT